jgi:hypothetical protein
MSPDTTAWAMVAFWVLLAVILSIALTRPRMR